MPPNLHRGPRLAAFVAILGTLGGATLAAGAISVSGTPVGTILYEDTGKCTYDHPSGPHLGESCSTTLWTVNARTRWRRHLTPDLGGDQAAWSPDGRSILFIASPGGGLWTMRADGSAKRPLTARGSAWSPTWSPDGRRIAFVTGRAVDLIAVVNANGGGRRTLARANSEVAELVWSPRGEALAYSTYEDRIYVVDAEGGSPEQLDNGRDPTWSPDGSRIAFVQEVVDPSSGNTRASHLNVIEVDGSDWRRLTRGEPYDSDPTWAPSGRELAFTRRAAWDKPLVLYRIRPDGSGLRRVTAPADNPAWSPGGKWIAFDHDDGHVYAVRPDGRDRTKLAPGGAPLHWRPGAGRP